MMGMNIIIQIFNFNALLTIFFLLCSYYKTDANKISTNSHRYKGGGFSKNLFSKFNDSLDMINNIYDSAWIDRATRLVILELNLFYDATEMFQLTKHVF